MTHRLARMRVNMRRCASTKLLGGGAALVALLVALAAVSQPAEAQTTLPACTVTQAGEGDDPAAVPCTRTIPGTGTVSAVWKSGGTKTLASDSPSVSGRVVTFTPSDRDADSEDDTGSAVYEIVVTDNGIALNRYTITVTTYAAGQAPAAPAPTGPQPKVYKIEFLDLAADGVVQPGTNVTLKLTRVDDANHILVTKSVSVKGLSLRVVERRYFADDTRQVGDAGDPDTDPDVSEVANDFGQTFDVTRVDFGATDAYQGIPQRGRYSYAIDAILENGCYVGSDECGSGNDLKPGEATTEVVALEIVVPPDATAGEYVVTVKGYKSLTDTTLVTETRTLTVGAPSSATAVSFGPSSPRRAVTGDTDTTPKDGYVDDTTTMEPTTITASTGTTELTLSVLGADGKPARASAVSSIVITTTGGTLSTQQIMNAAGTKVDQPATCKSNGQAACELDFASLKTSGDPLPAKMRIQLKAPATPGMATVTATVISGGQVHQPDPVQVRFSGPATSLSIGAAPSNVLGYNVGNDQAADYNAATKADTGMDARDQITFTLDATDASGSEVTVPTVSAMLKTSSGALVAQSKYQTTQSGSMMNKLMLDIDAAMTSALAAGTYTLEVTAGTLKASTTLMVVGAADEVDLTLDPMQATEIGQGVTASVMATDAAGNAVADGTMVTFGVSDLVGDDDAVAVLDDTTALTMAGKAATTLTVVGAGRAVVRATVSDDSTPERDVEVLISTAGAPAAPAAEASLDCLSALSGFATWTCDVESTASEVFGLVSARGASAVHLWNGSAWIRYSVVGGTMVPGSSDFMVGRSDILYISN